MWAYIAGAQYQAYEGINKEGVGEDSQPFRSVTVVKKKGRKRHRLYWKLPGRHVHAAAMLMLIDIYEYVVAFVYTVDLMRRRANGARSRAVVPFPSPPLKDSFWRHQSPTFHHPFHPFTFMFISLLSLVIIYPWKVSYCPIIFPSSYIYALVKLCYFEKFITVHIVSVDD